MSQDHNDGDVCVCFMTPSDNGRIVSSQIGSRNFTQSKCACNETKGLPLASDPHPHALTVSVREVTCPKCIATPEFLARYEECVGHEHPSVTTTAAPLPPTPEASPSEVPAPE